MVSKRAAACRATTTVHIRERDETGRQGVRALPSRHTSRSLWRVSVGCSLSILPVMLIDCVRVRHADVNTASWSMDGCMEQLQAAGQQAWNGQEVVWIKSTRHHGSAAAML